jgi:hypothetical protein
MSDTTIVGRHVDVVQASIGTQPPFSWGAAIAGALAAIAISFILIALGAGVGLLKASPYQAWPSMTTLTALGAIWIVLAQTWGYACGGYIAGRVRTRAPEASSDETNFRDGVHGLVSWALGVVLVIAMFGIATMFAVGTGAHVGATLGAGAASGAGSAMQGQSSSGSDSTGYFSDLLFRPDPNVAARQATATQPATPGTGPAAGTGSGGAPASSPQGETPPAMQTAGGQDFSQRGEVGRIMTYSLGQGRMTDADRSYLAGLVAQRTGMTQAEAEQRVAATEQQLRESAKEVADKAAKASAAFSFWTFMSLLMGAAAAVLGGIFGGNQRDDELFGDRVPRLSPNR